MLNQSLRKKIETLLDEAITRVSPISGGCSFSSFSLETNSKKLFLKYSNQATSVFMNEATGLKCLAHHSPHTPKVIGSSDDFLLLEWIESEQRNETFWVHLGETLANLHQASAPFYGFTEDNWVGAAPQKNRASQEAKGDWAQFFWQNRILAKIDELEEKQTFLFDREQKHQLKRACVDQLSSFKSRPCPLHGDLWSGNILCGPSQKAYLIDPAFYYGDREADLAMTECFGGFHPIFYETYNGLFPLDEGYSQRKPIYNLYHMLNHQVIFGSSYEASVLQLFQQITSTAR